VLEDPTFRTLGLASCLIVVWFLFGPFPDHQAPRQLLVRHDWRQCADVVLVGDSSLLIGVRPEIVEAQLASSYRVASFGYPDGSLSDLAYLDAAEAILDPSSPGRTMVFSITSANTNFISAKYDAYGREGRELATARAAGHPPSLALDWTDELDLRLRPRGVCWSLWGVCSWGMQKVFGYNGQYTFPTSWYDPTYFLPQLITDYDTDEALYSDTNDARMFQRIAELVRRGVGVVAYVERDYPRYAEVTEAHGYDPARLARELRATGATVLDYPEDLSTYDGEHLDRPSQERFSRLLGQALARRLPPRTHAPTGHCRWPLETGAGSAID
jgi:hypothetical protein